MSGKPTTTGMGAGSSPASEPTREELLELIREGADKWNAWRNRHPKIKIDLSGIQFVQQGIKNFSKFEFGDVNFSGCYFDHETDFTGAAFGRADFAKSIFGNEVTFESAKFQSIGRPALGLAASTIGFWFAYDSLAVDGDNLPIGDSGKHTTRTSALFAFTASRFLPLIGASRRAAQDAEIALFTCAASALPPESVQLLSTLQGLINAVLIFLLLLAIRNHFRMG